MSANTLATLNGFYKQIYGDSLINLIPESAKFIKDVPFERRKKLGDYYNVPVVLQAEQGFTYNDGDGTAFALNGALAMGTKNAQVRGAEKVLQSQISYNAAAAATSNKEAFADATSTLFENMVESMANRLELSCFYGQSDIAEGRGSVATESTTGASASFGVATFTRATTTATVTTTSPHGLVAGQKVYFTDDSGSSVVPTTGLVLSGGLTATQFTLTVNTGTNSTASACTIAPMVRTGSATNSFWFYVDRNQWSTGLWAGKVGAELQIFLDDNSTLISSGVDSVFTIAAIDPQYKRIRITSTSTGTTAIETAVGTKANFDTGLRVYFNGTYTGSAHKDFVGIDRIITYSGTDLFGIDNTVYSLFKGNEFTASGALSLSQIISATENAVAQGLMEDVCAYVPISAWNTLANTESGLRRYDQSYKNGKAENGVQSLAFYGANGKIEIEPHPILKAGEVFIIPKKQFIRVGATDVTFQTPGMDSTEIFLQLPSNAGYEVRAYADQALLCMAPAKCTKVTGFTVA
jgi:hypothetical protein